MRLAIAFLTLAVMLPGCMRVQFDSPAIRGQVMDRDTGRPVLAALVSIKERPSTTAKSDAAGRFELPPIREAWLVPPFADAVYLGCCSRGTVLVQAIGYKVLQHAIDEKAPAAVDLRLRLERE